LDSHIADFENLSDVFEDFVADFQDQNLSNQLADLQAQSANQGAILGNVRQPTT
jgi:hypothetical protein